MIYAAIKAKALRWWEMLITGIEQFFHGIKEAIQGIRKVIKAIGRLWRKRREDDDSDYEE